MARDLPPGYFCEIDADRLVLRGPDFRAVAYFAPHQSGAAIRDAAEKDAAKNGVGVEWCGWSSCPVCIDRGLVPSTEGGAA